MSKNSSSNFSQSFRNTAIVQAAQNYNWRNQNSLFRTDSGQLPIHHTNEEAASLNIDLPVYNRNDGDLDINSSNKYVLSSSIEPPTTNGVVAPHQQPSDK